VLAIVPTIGLVVRIHAEERGLLTVLGEPYRRFTATRQRPLPGIW
jgi:protein-S-isoprenylcysteine O-methyltransferase Ste14